LRHPGTLLALLPSRPDSSTWGGDSPLRRARPGTPRGSVRPFLLALLAGHAQGRPRKGHQPHLADRVAAGLAYAVGVVVDPLEGPLDLGEHVAGIVEDGQLVV